MVIDIVIPLGTGSYWENNELRYCLRGIEKHLSNYRNIYIIGSKPDFLNNGVKGHEIIHYPFVDRHNHERNIYEKIKFACAIEGVSENFFFMNDDHFIIDKIDAPTYPYYFKSTLTEKITNRVRNDGYCISMRNSRDVLPTEKQIYFDIHTPIVYNKEKFLNTVGKIDWNRGMGYVIKSVYCNMNEVIGEQYSDLKIKGSKKLSYLKDRINGRHVFSIADSAVNSDLKQLMDELYPNRSAFEIIPRSEDKKHIYREKYYAARRG